jgi:histidinol-phosphatase
MTNKIPAQAPKLQSKEMTFALDIARKAGEVAAEYFRNRTTGTMKSDNTPVTIADQKCERMIREALAQSFPDDEILGEEEGESATKATNKRKWIIDPIDGTYNFTRQVPVWSLLLALEEDGEIILGIVNAPSMGEMYWAEKGGGAFRNGEPTRVSTIATLAESQFEFGAPNRLASDGYWDALRKICEQTYRQRGFGDYLNFGHVFEGKAEAAIEIGVKAWDIAPMKIIVEEAGGRYTDLEGGSSIYKGGCLVSNGLVHEDLLKILHSR